MPFESIRKPKSSPDAAPNLADYANACAKFDWNDARRELDGFPGGGLNIAYEALDRHG